MSVSQFIKRKKLTVFVPLIIAGLIKVCEFLFDVIFGDGDGNISQPVVKQILKYLYLFCFAAFFLTWIVLKFRNKTKTEMIFQAIFSGILVVFTFFLAEITVYLLLCFSINIVSGSPNYITSYSAISKPMAYFHKETGYKWKPGEARIIRVMNNELIYDYRFIINNSGYHSARNYNTKKDSLAFRIMVMGDSFTNEIYEEPWIDKIQRKSDSLGKKLEWYAFSSDGGGLYNWHEIFFNEIVPSYDFDAIVISSFIDNLNRGYSIFDSEDNEQFKFARFNKIPNSLEDFNKNFLPKMGPTFYVLNEAGMDSVKNVIVNKKPKVIKWNFYLSKHIYNTYLKNPDEIPSAYKLPNAYSLKDMEKLSAKEIIEKMRQKYPPNHINMLEKIITYCKQNNKKVILSCVPKREFLVDYLKSAQDNIYRAEIKAAAEVYEVYYFDGYKVFEGVKSENVPEYYLKFDGHWAEKGSSAYAGKLLEFVNNNLNKNGKN